MSKIEGVLHTERFGPASFPPMVFVHPNPMDSSSWLFQIAHMSTWFQAIAIDLPGYGRSPRLRQGATMVDIAEACWRAVEQVADRPAILVGCSVGSNVVQHMYHIKPDKTRALVVSGAGYRPHKPFTERITGYKEGGLAYREQYGKEVMSPSFRETPLAQWLVSMMLERNDSAHLESIVWMFEALAVPDPDWLQRDLHAPVLILTGSEDNTHQAAFALRDRLPQVELEVIQGAGHICHFEQPWEFDRLMIAFLSRRGLLPGSHG